jgi:carboxyl-terminal processing protease
LLKVLLGDFPGGLMSKLRLTMLILVSLASVARPAAWASPSTIVQSGARSERASGIDPRQDTFEIVWRTVKEKHFDPSFGGVDWDQVKQKYLPLLAAVKTDEQLYTLLQNMLGELHESHFAIIPPEALADDAASDTNGDVGIDIRILDGRAVVTRVEPGSPAERAGLSPGFIIESLDGIAVADLTKRFEAVKGPESLKELRAVRSILARTHGKPGSALRMKWIGKDDQARESTLERAQQPGELSEAIGNFPPQRFEFESRRLAGNIGYIRFNIFVVKPVMDQIRTAIRSMVGAPGLIIDLRGNPGGVGSMSAGMAGLLETGQVSLGVMKMRSGFQNMMASPQPQPYLGPVVILIDGLSASTSEVFASGMQELGRAVVVGQRSAGAALPSIFQKLPTGALFQYAIADFRTPKGILIEGRGVIPDVQVGLTREALLAGTDLQLEAAIKALRKPMSNQSNGSSN